jgi:putative DNA primase/helicase
MNLNYYQNNGSGPASISLVAKDHPNVLEAAKAYTKAGIYVTPVVGKKPVFDEWPELLLDEADLPSHFVGSCNVGALLGEPSGGLVDIDLDVRQAVGAADALLPGTLGYGRKQNRRSHRLYLCDPIPKTKKYRLTKAMAQALGFSSEEGAMLVELRSTGQQSVFPPSMHPKDKDEYAWDGGQIQQMDRRDLEELVREVATATLLSLYCHSGFRQELFLAAAGYLGRHLDHERVEAILEAATTAAGDEEPEKRAQAIRDTFEKLQNGENATGGPTLEDLAPGVPALLAKWWGWGRSRNGNGGKQKAPTHDELRDRWRDQYPDVVYGLDEWKRYANGIYVAKDEFEVRQEISEIVEEAKREGIRPTASLLSSVTELARVKVAVASGKWDSDLEVLVCGNGTLHIPTRALRAHDRRDYVTSALPYDYDPDANAELWRAFIEATLPDAWEFVQEFAGFSLTTDCSLETALWLQGHRGSGKSTLIEGFLAMLGHRAGFLGLGDIERSRFALSELPGKTLVVATEQPSSYLQSTDILDRIISGEPVTVDRKYREPLTVRPHSKVLWAMNDLPRVSNTTSGIFRRVKVIKFPNPPTKPNPLLKEVIKTEGAGILNWALDGLDRLRNRGGFLIPPSVQAATDAFQGNNDVPGMFVEDHCILGDGHKVQSSVLYERYVAWCTRNGHKASSSTRVADDWERLGFERTTIKGKKYWKGLTVPELSFLDDSFSWVG